MSAAVTLASTMAKVTRRRAIDPRPSGRSRHHRVPVRLAALLAVAVASASIAAEPDRLTPETAEPAELGFRVPHTGLWVGGFGTIEASVPQSQPATVGLGDMGLLLRWELTPTLTFFNETDLDDV